MKWTIVPMKGFTLGSMPSSWILVNILLYKLERIANDPSCLNIVKYKIVEQYDRVKLCIWGLGSSYRKHVQVCIAMIDWRLGYAKWGHRHRLGACLHFVERAIAMAWRKGRCKKFPKKATVWMRARPQASNDWNFQHVLWEKKIQKAHPMVPTQPESVSDRHIEQCPHNYSLSIV